MFGVLRFLLWICTKVLWLNGEGTTFDPNPTVSLIMSLWFGMRHESLLLAALA